MKRLDTLMQFGWSLKKGAGFWVVCNRAHETVDGSTPLQALKKANIYRKLKKGDWWL